MTFKSVTHALFQARMWREHARAFDGVPTSNGIPWWWVVAHLKMDRRQCLDRAWEAARAAKQLNAESK